MKKWIFRISITFNLIFILLYFWSQLNSPTNEIGRLEKDVEIKHFQSDEIIFKIPKGINVKNVSARGLGAIGQFENERFSIVITSNDPRLVNYDLPKDSLNMFGNFYSAEKYKTRSRQEFPEGEFIYELYFSEFGGRMDNRECLVTIKEKKIKIEQTEKTNLPGEKLLFEGILIKHKSGKWIIGENPEDKNADEIGGCSGGPIPIDFENQVIEWC